MEPRMRLNDRRTRTETILGCMAVVSFCVLIWSFSAEPAAESSQTSGRISRMIAGWLFGTPSEEQYGLMEMLVRKAAHMTEFACLYCLFFYTMHGEREDISKACFFCFLFACSDELHQAFVPGRSCRLTDVIIDMIGVGFAVILANMFPVLIRHREHRRF